MDDLTTIKGIGPKRAAELAAMGIDSFTALAAADPQHLETTMEVSPAQIATWQQTAAMFAREQVVGVDRAVGQDETATAVSPPPHIYLLYYRRQKLISGNEVRYGCLAYSSQTNGAISGTAAVRLATL